MLGGFCVVEAADLDEALELAARVPAARLGRAAEAGAAYRRALELATTTPERRF